MPTNNVERDADAIIQRAGLAPWGKPLHTLRKSLESDWLGTHPVLDVTKWLGNSPDVARKHYHQSLPETVRRVTEEPALPRKVPESA
jgi:hypothetical protein